MMVLYSGTTCPYSHRCRFVLFEKGMDFEIRDVDLFAKPEDIALMNPYNEAVGDLVAYLTWMSEPAQAQRVRLGVWVLIFLALFTAIAWRLNASYWKDVK